MFVSGDVFTSHLVKVASPFCKISKFLQLLRKGVNCECKNKGRGEYALELGRHQISFILQNSTPF